MFSLFAVSIWVILISLVFNMAGGMLWYGPLFGKQWMAGMGYKEEDKESMQKTAGPAYAASAVFAIIFGYAIDLLFGLLPSLSLGGVLLLTLIVYVGLVLGNTIKGFLWGEISKSVFIINTAFELVYFGVMSVVAYYL